MESKPKKVTELRPEKPVPRPKRVCAYARVSDDKDSMLRSLSAQVSHYNGMISSHPGWVFAGVYSDEGISGTKEDRPGFQEMMADARKGLFDMVITKSISRFARNVATVLSATRELKSLGIGVYFEAQRMDTLSQEGEFMLSVLASFYQEEARSVSENMRWRIRNDFAKGLAWGGNDSYGYLLKGRKLEINPEQAPVVRRIFDMYVGGLGASSIAKILNREGVPPLRGKEWGTRTVLKIISNPQYIGDRVLQSTYREGYMGKKAKANKGQMRMYYVEDDHEPIVSREIYAEAQRIRRKRAEAFASKEGEKGPLSGKLRCSVCGGPLKKRKARGRAKYSCIRYDGLGKEACPGVGIVDAEALESAVAEALGAKELSAKAVEKVEKITVFPGKTAEIAMKDGSVLAVGCAGKSRKESWTPEMKEKARQKELERRKKEEK